MQIRTKHFWGIAVTMSAFLLLFSTAQIEAKYSAEGAVIAYPNPFNPVTHTLTIKPKLSAGFAGAVTFIVYDYNQREVYRGQSPAGSAIQWSGYDSRGTRVAPGLYFIKLIHVQTDQTTSVSILKVIIQ